MARPPLWKGVTMLTTGAASSPSARAYQERGRVGAAGVSS